MCSTQPQLIRVRGLYMAIYGYIYIYGYVHPKICIWSVWTCILGVWTCFCWCLDLFGGVWTCFGMSGLVFRCLDLYSGCCILAGCLYTRKVFTIGVLCDLLVAREREIVLSLSLSLAKKQYMYCSLSLERKNNTCIVLSLSLLLKLIDLLQ